MQQQTIEMVKSAVDVTSAAVVLGTLAAWLPPMAAALTIVWTAIRITETRRFREVVRWSRKRIFNKE